MASTDPKTSRIFLQLLHLQSALSLGLVNLLAESMAHKSFVIDELSGSPSRRSRHSALGYGLVEYPVGRAGRTTSGVVYA